MHVFCMECHYLYAVVPAIMRNSCLIYKLEIYRIKAKNKISESSCRMITQSLNPSIYRLPASTTGEKGENVNFNWLGNCYMIEPAFRYTMIFIAVCIFTRMYITNTNGL